MLKIGVFEENAYPLSAIKHLMKEIEEKQKQKEATQLSMTEQANPQEQKIHSLLLPFPGPKGTTAVKNLKQHIKKYFQAM